MEPRVLSRTHYQVDEPAFTEVVVSRCTSPVASTYDDSVAERLARDIRARGKSFNIAAARYAVDLAHRLNVIGSNNVWTENGHLVNLVATVGDRQWTDELTLTVDETLLHFRLFLEADGAAFVFLAKLLLSEEQLPAKGSDWNDLATDMFLATYANYLAVTNPTADRMALRSKIDRLRSQRYQGKSGAHKLFLHLQTLHRLGLVERVSASNERQYSASDKSRERLERLIAAIPDILALERVVQGHRQIEVAAQVYGLHRQHEMLNPSEALCHLLPSYLKVVGTGVAICPLAPIIEATQVSLLTTTSRLLKYADFIALLREAQLLHLRDIRFHQDRRGNPAFLKLSDDLIRRLAVEGPNSHSLTVTSSGSSVAEDI